MTSAASPRQVGGRGKRGRRETSAATTPANDGLPDPGPTVAYAHGEPFNVIDTDTGWNVDLILRRDRPFSRMEFSRRRSARIEDIEVFVATAEDTILAKLEWACLGQSKRQLADVAAIVRTSSLSLDRA